MGKKTFNLEFSERLRGLMIARGHASYSASSGVSPTALCKGIGCFTEMALRYLDGRSIPSPENILKIAAWLDVEPGFLLFGEQGAKKSKQDHNKINIDKDLLIYALQKALPIIKNVKHESEALEFFISILLDLSQMEIETEQLKKVFDLTIRSTTFLEKEILSETKDYAKAVNSATS